MICHSNSHSFSSLGTLHSQGLGCSPQGCQKIKGQRSNVTLGVHSAPFWPRTGSLHRSLLPWSVHVPQSMPPFHVLHTRSHANKHTHWHTFFQSCWIQVFSYAYFSIVHFIHLHTATEINGCLCGIQARTQGFEKGGYIVEKFPLNIWHLMLSYSSTCKNKQFHREHEAH